MQKKNLRRTDGMPLYLGVAAAVLLLLYFILQAGPSQAYTQSLLANQGITNLNPTGTYIGYVISFLIYPGIFLILLAVGAGKPRRGSTFAVLWLVIAALNVISSVYGMIKPSDLKTIADVMVPGGFYLYSSLGLLGSLCVLASCIMLLKRLHTPEFLPENGETPAQDR